MANEKRLIDINKFPLLPSRLDGDMTEYERGYLDAQANLNLLPIVDAVEVVHGRWITTLVPDGYVQKASRLRKQCSVCGWTNACRYKYCPNCGAKMDGDGNV